VQTKRRTFSAGDVARQEKLDNAVQPYVRKRKHHAAFAEDNQPNKNPKAELATPVLAANEQPSSAALAAVRKRIARKWYETALIQTRKTPNP